VRDSLTDWVERRSGHQGRALAGIGGAALACILAILLVISMLPAKCDGNPLDDCTLQNMVGVSSDEAAKFIRKACLGKISTTIQFDSLPHNATANIALGQFSRDSHLYVNFENKSNYAITELMIRVYTDHYTRWNDYEVTNFLPIYTGPVGVFPTGLPPDPASYLQIRPFSTVHFSFPIREKAPKGKWGWDLLSAKGYMATDDPASAITEPRQVPDYAAQYLEQNDEGPDILAQYAARIRSERAKTAPVSIEESKEPAAAPSPPSSQPAQGAQ
jgi:hypothetical protein